jgi:hypothetical protein
MLILEQAWEIAYESNDRPGSTVASRLCAERLLFAYDVALTVPEAATTALLGAYPLFSELMTVGTRELLQELRGVVVKRIASAKSQRMWNRWLT